MTSKLNCHEIKALRILNGDETDIMGAWFNSCCEYLKSRGYVSKIPYQITEKGKKYISAADNTRAVPGVPELVRWKQYEHGIPKMISGHGGDWCEYDQAAAAIAVEKQAAIDARNLLQYEKDQQWQERALAAEAKLANIEKQEAVAHILTDVLAELSDNGSLAVLASVRKRPYKSGGTALYAAPFASDAELRAENERLKAEKAAMRKAATDYCWQRYKGRDPMNLNSPAVYTSHEWQKIGDAMDKAVAALKPSEPRT